MVCTFHTVREAALDQGLPQCPWAWPVFGARCTQAPPLLFGGRVDLTLFSLYRNEEQPALLWGQTWKHLLGAWAGCQLLLHTPPTSQPLSSGCLGQGHRLTEHELPADPVLGRQAFAKNSDAFPRLVQGKKFWFSALSFVFNFASCHTL